MNATVGLFAQHLAPFRRRLQWRDGLRAAWMTTSGGLAFTCLLLIAGRLRPLVFQWQLLLIGLSLTLFAFSLGQLFAWFRPVSLWKLARLGDARLGLDERLITALELAEGRLETSPNLKQAQLDDTFNRLNSAPLPSAIPLVKRNQQWFAVGIVLVLTATATALTVIPNPQQSTLEERAELVEFLETEITELEEIQADILPEIEVAASSQVEPTIETLDALIDRLQTARNELSPESALAALTEADQTLQELDRQRQAQEQAMSQLASSLTNSELAASPEQTASQPAAEALQQLAENPPQSGAEADALAQSLAEAAAAAGDNPALAQSLLQAAEALQSGDAQGAQAALAQAAGQLAQSDAQAAASAAQLQQALENIQQARAQLAQQNGQGTGGESAGQGDGSGQRSGTGSGSGRGDPGAGNDGLFSAQGVDGTISTDNGPNQNRLNDYNSVYAPDHLGGTGGDFVVPDPQGADGSGIDIGETPLNPNRPPGESTVPYTEVYREYANQAGAALDGEYIPLGMKDYVRQYFGSLEP